MIQVVSIQSQVVYGSAGNSAVLFPMQRAGVSVAAVPTTILSNTPHYPTTYGNVLDAKWLSGLLQGVEDREIVGDHTVILSGYLGSVENAEVVLRFVERMRDRHPDIRYICDPVMGDDDYRTYVPETLVDFFRDHLVPLATMTTPNQYELELLARRSARTCLELQEAGQILRSRGTKGIIATGCVLNETETDHVESILIENSSLVRVSTRRLPIRPTGTGDLFTAGVVMSLLKGEDLSQACENATENVYRVLLKTLECSSREMEIIKS